MFTTREAHIARKELMLLGSGCEGLVCCVRNYKLEGQVSNACTASKAFWERRRNRSASGEAPRKEPTSSRPTLAAAADTSCCRHYDPDRHDADPFCWNPDRSETTGLPQPNKKTLLLPRCGAAVVTTHRGG